MKEVLPYQPHDRTGRVINVSYISATEGLQGQTFYGGSKAALDAMTRTVNDPSFLDVLRDQRCRLMRSVVERAGE